MSNLQALNVDRISFSYGKQHALKDVTFDLERGKFTVLLGQNGAGKTTLANLIHKELNNYKILDDILLSIIKNKS